MTLQLSERSTIILDLDDTIYPTKSIPNEVIQPVFNKLRSQLGEISEELFTAMKRELWHSPIDIVGAKYNFPLERFTSFYDDMEKLQLKGTGIKLFEDYRYVRSLPFRKYLVTTGLHKYQYAKIEALGIEEDFITIHIDDPRSQPRKGKLGIIKDIIASEALDPKEVWVIGDNPSSELSAGHELGCVVVQRASTSKPRYDQANLHINSFHELSTHTSI